MTRITAPLPPSIRRVLGRLDRRVRAAAAARGLGTAAVVIGLGGALGMAADFAWPLPRAARWALWGTWLAVGAVWLAAKVARPLFRKARALDLAAVAERSDPGLGERLTAAVALLGEHESISGSPALIAALADDADRRAGGVEIGRAVPFRGAGTRLAWGAVVLGLVAAPALVSGPYRALGGRFLAPWSDRERIGRWVVDVRPGDKTVALGSDLEVSAEFRPRFGAENPPAVAWLEGTDAAGVHRVAMPAAEGRGAFAVTLPRVWASCTYRVVSDSAESRTYQVRAVPPPAVAWVTARIEPPKYTRWPAGLARDPARIEAWEGSRVTLEVQAKAAVRTIEVDWPDDRKSHREALTLADESRGSIGLRAEVSGAYLLTLRDQFGLTSRPEGPRQVVVRPDAPPVVAVRGAEDVQESKPDDTLRVAVAARDDVAVASVQLHYAIERAGTGPEAGHTEVTLPGLDTQAAKGETTWELKPLGLKPGDTLRYRVRVADNRPGPRGPNVVWSPGRTLTIVAQADPILARQDRARRDDLQAKLDALKKAAAENRQEAEQLRYAADAVQRGNGAWDKDRRQALVRREAEARAVEDQLQLFARDLEADAHFRPLARPARQVAEVEAEAGRALLDQARRAEGAEARLSDLRQADARLGAVSEKLEDLQRQFDSLAQRDADRRRLRDLADREEALAHKAEALDDADRARLDQLQAEQAAVRKDLDELLRQSPELRADVLDAEAKEAEDLAKKARDLARRQREEARQSTDLSKQAQALKALADEQRALEDDARRLALDVDAPLAENFRGRLNTQQVKEPVAPIERGDLDQARPQLQGAEAELRRLARDLEDVPNDPKALAHRLLRRQDALNAQVAEAVAEFQTKKDLAPDEKAALAARLKPLAERQEAIAQLSDPENFQSQIANGKFPVEAAQKSTRKAAEGLRDAANPRAIREQQQAAHRDLAKLAHALPDHWQRQAPARKQLDEARRLSHEAARELERTHPDQAAQKQSQAAEALAALEPEPRARPQRDRAARRAQALADALKAGDRKAVPALQLEARAAFERLEQKMNGQVPADDLAAELAAEPLDDPRRLATALRNLNAPDAAPLLAEAVRAADALPRPDTPHPKPDSPLSKTPSRAAKDALEALARTLNDQPAGSKPNAEPQHPPADPDLLLKPGQAEQARNLARRERQVRERLQAVLGERIPQQQALRNESEALGRELAELREQSRPVTDRGQGPLNEAAGLLGDQAPRAMTQGAEHLAQGQPAPARDDQRRAAELVERGAQDLDDFAAALRAERPAATPNPGPPGPVAEARDAAQQAAQELGQARAPGQAHAAQAAGQAMRQAAQGLRASALAAQGPNHDAPDTPEGPTKNPHSAPAGTAAPDLSALQEMVRRKTGRAWGELPGHLRTEILQMSQGRYRDDYARLIQLYFREIAAGAGREAEKP